MPTIPLHLQPLTPPASPPHCNPLPQLLHTPSGLALLELQGHFNLPPSSPTATSSIPIGHFTFPADPATDKRVYLHIGKHQRMTGVIKQLPTPLGVMQRRPRAVSEDVNMTGDGERDPYEGEELEIAEVVRWKVVFSSRPEPVGDDHDGGEGEKGGL
jgi:chromosome transmission fidelity protein 8